jgi:cystathionine beta-lyase
MYDFDKFPDRAGSDSVKWHEVQGSILPMWVADMDFESAPPVIKAIQERAAHPYFGYPYTQDLLKDHVIAHYKKKYGVTVRPEWIVWVPSVIPGVVAALQMMGGKFMYSIPMYDHIRNLNAEAKLPVVEVPMKRDENNRYSMDMDALEAVLSPDIKCLILCNPHNPVGRVYTKEELLRLEAFCTRHHLLVISDEIHCELDLEDRHIPFFAVSDDAAAYSVTRSSAGKICNIPGLPVGVAIIPNESVRENFISRQDGLQPCGNVLTLAAYEKAYDGSCDQWKEELRDYLRENRDIAEARFAKIPEIQTPHNEGTYLLWLDCTGLGTEDPADFFLKRALVKVSSGKIYGYSRYVRFNYACPRSQLIEALDRMEEAIDIWRKNKK